MKQGSIVIDEKKKEKLEKVKANLKKYFVGLDNIIDHIIRNLEIWYLLPDILTRPVIINLWGLTGVGKTDLVRRLVSELEMENFFTEVELNINRQGSQTVQDDMKYSNIISTAPGILLLDEIQRFRTMSEDGKLLDSGDFKDIWTLLSDGQFANTNRETERLYSMLMGLLYDKDWTDSKNSGGEDVEPQEESNKEDTEKPTKERKFKSSVWESQQFKRNTESNLDIKEIMMLSREDKIRIVEEKLKNILKYKTKKVYSKLLIFICGNIDEAYSMSNSVSDIDTDADVLHAFSKSISVIDIKDALKLKFKPEQIARLGNIHIIYPSLSKESFMILIKKRLKDISKKMYDKTNIKIKFNKNIVNAIYRNGVFPAQGVRPLYSTINSVIENSLPEFIMSALTNNENTIDLKFYKEGKENYISSVIGNKTINKKVILDQDYLKNTVDKQELSYVSAHEAGHAVAYSVLFKTAPAQIVGNSSMNSNLGFTFPHIINENKNYILKKIMILLAGTVSEEIIFGDKYKTNGASRDITQSTKLASFFVRQWGMDGFVGIFYPLVESSAASKLTNIEDTNAIIEEILKEQKKKVEDLLHNNINLLKDVISLILEKTNVTPEDFSKVAKNHIPNIKIRPHDSTIYPDYTEKLNKFLNS
jgi:cell division protease FtsH